MVGISIKHIRHSLVFKVILSVSFILLISISIWSIFHLRYFRKEVMRDMVEDSAKLSKMIKLGTHYAMMFNARDGINQIVKNIGKFEDIKHIRIYNKTGQIKFSNLSEEVGHKTSIKDEACFICHQSEPPLSELELIKRQRIFFAPDGLRLLGIISPIYNEPGCSTASCHAHQDDKKVLGALDLVMSLAETDREIEVFQNWHIALAAFIFVMTATIIFWVLLKFFIDPIQNVIKGTQLIAKGNYTALHDFNQRDEIGYLANAIDKMGEEIGKKQLDLNKQKDEYQKLFELVPCIITVQDRNFKLIQYNQEFSKRFGQCQGDYCYLAYKGRSVKCENCPVEKTFQDGECHYSEETGINKDGSIQHWVVKTAPMKNEQGEIIAAMEMNLDITHLKKLEEKLNRSEKQYYAFFNQIPNPVFVIDAETLSIIDCNESVESVYGFNKSEVLERPFLDFFFDEDRKSLEREIKELNEINRVKHMKKDGEVLYVNIRISPSEYPGQKVFLVTTSDVTKRLESELQLVQAGKMATLGEMATGVAHELNQPLSVIKTASNFLMKKIRKKEKIQEDTLLTMAEEIDGHVDRASGIISHLRQFGRKSDITLERVQVNDALERSFEMFRQQLKLRQIEVGWDLKKNLPPIMAELSQLEQVFINLLINARDAIEEKWKTDNLNKQEDKTISLKTFSSGNYVCIEICDNGTGIPKNRISKVFEPFYTTKGIGEGTGIGLSISYRIIEEFKGQIKVVSTEGSGTCFTIQLPKSEKD